MKVFALSMDKNLCAIGFRRVVSAAKDKGYDVDAIYFLDDAWGPSLAGSWWNHDMTDDFTMNFASTKSKRIRVSPDDAVKRIAEVVKDGDVLAFSCMSVQAKIAQSIVEETKKLNPAIKVIIGGYHPSIFPDHAITFADAICLGEGELVFLEFLQRVQARQPLKGLPGTWTNDGGEISKNPHRPVMKPEEVEQMPFMEYGVKDNYLFSYAHGLLKPLEVRDVVYHNGTTLNTIWSVGCPFKCTFCSNDVMIDIDKKYSTHRGPSPEYMVGEIKNVIKQGFPLDYVIFYDSNFLGRTVEELEEFARLFKKELGLKFILSGTNPTEMKEEKIKPLVNAGLVRIKMGVESGSNHTLKLFKRPSRVHTLLRSTEVLNRYTGRSYLWSKEPRMVVPAFEMIVDNPFEEWEHVYETLDFFSKVPHPFTLSMFSLQFMPGTKLSDMINDFSKVEAHIDKDYQFSYKPNLINNLYSLYAIGRPPRWLMKILIKLVKGREEKEFPRMKTVLFKAMLIRRGLNHLRYGDLSNFPTYSMMVYHRYKRFISPKYRRLYEKLAPVGTVDQQSA
jgi:anaerobic magnesium-protoporphyrin IX monomethyl ester cyclase